MRIRKYSAMIFLMLISLGIWAAKDAEWKPILKKGLQQYQDMQADKNGTPEYQRYFKELNERDKRKVFADLLGKKLFEQSEEEIRLIKNELLKLQTVFSSGMMKYNYHQKSSFSPTDGQLSYSDLSSDLPIIMDLIQRVFRFENIEGNDSETLQYMEMQLDVCEKVQLYGLSPLLNSMQSQEQIHYQIYWNLLLSENPEYKKLGKILSTSQDLLTVSDLLYVSTRLGSDLYCNKNKTKRFLYNEILSSLTWDIEELKQAENRRWLGFIQRMNGDVRNLYLMQPTSIAATRKRLTRLLETETESIKDPICFDLLNGLELPFEMRFMIAVSMKMKFQPYWKNISMQKRLSAGCYLLQEYRKNGTLSGCKLPEAMNDISVEAEIMLGNRADRGQPLAFKVFNTQGSDLGLVKKYCWKMTYDILLSIYGNNNADFMFLEQSSSGEFRISIGVLNKQLQVYQKALAPLYSVNRKMFRGENPYFNNDKGRCKITSDYLSVLAVASGGTLEFTNIPKKLLIVEYGGQESVFILER